MMEYHHFEFGAQPQDRPVLHDAITADSEWREKDSTELETALGISIVEAMGALTTRMVLNPDAPIGAGSIVFSVEENPVEDSNMLIIPRSVITTTGFEPGKLQAWRERVAEAVEDKPMSFEIVDNSSLTDGEPRQLLNLAFDGTHYSLSRYGRPFTYVTENGQTIDCFAMDQWSIWDYHAEKRRQAIAERDHIGLHVQENILEIDDVTELEKISYVLSHTAQLYNHDFIITAKIKLQQRGFEREAITYRDIVDEVGIGKFTVGEGTMRYYDLLHAVAKDIFDPLQLALVQVWFATEGIRTTYGEAEETPALRQELQQLLENKIAETANASMWDGARLRTYLMSGLDQAADTYTNDFERYYQGNRFQHPRVTSTILAQNKFPELLNGQSYISLEEAIAVAQNPPSDAMLERLRELMRLNEDLETAEADEDYDKADYLESEIDKLMTKVEKKDEAYFARLDEATDAAEETAYSNLGIGKEIDSRTFLIEGILLAREITRLADSV